MARTLRNIKLDTRSARLKLLMRREPYWTVLSSGCAVGYRRGANGGSWIARLRDETGKQHYDALGAADDVRDADGRTVFSFAQAQTKARDFFKQKARELTDDFVPCDGPFTVARALDEYFAERKRRGSKGVEKDIAAAASRITPILGALEVNKLTTNRLRSWHGDLVTAPKPPRAGRKKLKPKVLKERSTDPDAVRARRSTANRTLSILKAALNYAFHEGRVVSDEPWRRTKPFRKVDAPIIRYLSEDEQRRLVNACTGAFRDLVSAALLTGCRYSELARIAARDYDATAKTITIRESKAGKPRHVALTAEGGMLFSGLAAGKLSTARLFLREDGEEWGPSHQQRPLLNASEAAKINPAVNFHILRHTYASLLAMKGVSMAVIAAQLGHSDTRMTEKHYAHLAPNYVADTVRAAFPDLGIVGKSNIATFTLAKEG